MDFNEQLFNQINQFAGATPWLHPVAVGYAKYGAVLFAILILLALWQARHAPDRRLAAAVWAGIATLLAVAINQPIAALVAEPRPYLRHPDTLVLISRSTDWSFPSDHAVMAGACAVGLLIAAPRSLGLIATAAALLLAATRVYVGAHYPVDVLAGLLLGALVAGIGWLVLGRVLTLLIERLRRLPLVDAVCAPPPPSSSPERLTA